MPNHQEIVSKLFAVIPKEVIYEITIESILAEIVHRLGEKALSLSVEDIELARDEVKAAIDHGLDPRDFIQEGLDAWMITLELSKTNHLI